ncbi:MAG: hypothetical protein Hals2KO_07200 [Halioglobus sp.]
MITAPTQPARLLRSLALYSHALYVALFTASTSAASFDLSVDRSLLERAADPEHSGPASSGLDLSLQNELFNVAVDYDFQVNLSAAANAAADQTRATQDDTAQRVAASLNSRALNKLLRGSAKVNADSIVHSTTGAYNYRVRPAYSRKLAKLATLDMNYQYLLVRPSSEAVPQAQHSYSLGLKGSLGGGRLRWSGTYSSAEVYLDRVAHIQSSETFRFRSDYKLLPDMRLQLNSAITERTTFGKNSDTQFLQTEYGAGLQWRPSAQYAVDLAVSQTGLSHTGEDTLLRRGTLSWFPRHDMKLSLNYGDTLVEGAPGLVFNTRLELDRF